MSAPKLPPITEEAFQRQVIAFAQLHGWRVAHFRKVRVQRRGGAVRWETPVQADGKGFPDLLLVRPARKRGQIAGVIAAELKVGRNRLTAEQSAWLADFDAVGVFTHVWRPEDWPFIEKALAGS